MPPVTASNVTPADAPRCGLLVPCRNGDRFLRRLAASAQSQTRAFDECWLFDDASTDDTAELATELGFRVIRSDRRVGPAAARNELAAACACDWLHFHDADDTMHPAYLSRSLAAAAGADLVICDMRWVRETDGSLEQVWHYDSAELASDPTRFLLNRTVGGINGLYRRSAWTEFGGFDVQRDYWEDLELSWRWLRAGARFQVVNEELVTAHRRDDSYSNAHLEQVWLSKVRLIESWLGQATDGERRSIAAEAEAIAGRLHQLGSHAGVRSALAVCRAAGGAPPTTSSRVLQFVRLFSSEFAFRLQTARRNLG